MSIELAEKLKTKLTDRWVVVDGTVPELKRFAQWTGKVRTVNMNCRALVEFDGDVDIGWYDIDPAFLTVVDGPRPKVSATAGSTPTSKAAATPVVAKASTPAPSVANAPAADATKISPLERIRQQQAAKKAGSSEVAPQATPAGNETTGSTMADDTGNTATDATASSPPAPAAAPSGKPLSPLDMIRKMGAAKRE